MSFPKLMIDLKKIKRNITSMLNECDKRGVELVAVEKLVAGDLQVAQTIVGAGVTTLADSRIKNLQKLKDINAKKMLLRIPMQSEIDELVKWVDVCLISELETIKLIDQKATSPIEIILMIESGDIREGLHNKETIFKTVEEITKMKYVKLVGLGTNFACFGATIPSVAKMHDMVALKRELEDTFKISIPTISAGNSSHISIWDDPEIPNEINQIRSGAAILMGFGLNDEPIPFLEMNAFTLQAEVVEVQVKPSASWGQKGLDAFGHEKHFEDIGDRTKAIIAIGRQDCPNEDMIPVDSNIQVLGQSSDHTILDITDSNIKYRVGDIIEFNLGYIGVLSCITTEFVDTDYK
ncbi:alanine racemase [[Acholeplasma] multilocale]|uniref:alanine racemase n=1 Tax=[Acholeplasma] multilocale TaxID=264638 RepID=UPI00047D6370|nr:alanine racemase [[Acholeplasma] multilocale]